MSKLSAMYQFQNDKYRKARGGKSRVSDVSCEGCEHHVAYYQKDGPGLLKRMYVDRFIDVSPESNELVCNNCERQLGIRINYKKEDRPAYRLFVGAVRKKTVSKDVV